MRLPYSGEVEFSRRRRVGTVACRCAPATPWELDMVWNDVGGCMGKNMLGHDKIQSEDCWCGVGKLNRSHVEVDIKGQMSHFGSKFKKCGALACKQALFAGSYSGQTSSREERLQYMVGAVVCKCQWSLSSRQRWQIQPTAVSGHPQGALPPSTQFSKQQAESRNSRMHRLFGGMRWNWCRSSAVCTEDGDAAYMRSTLGAPVGVVPQTDRACRETHLCLGRKEDRTVFGIGKGFATSTTPAASCDLTHLFGSRDQPLCPSCQSAGMWSRRGGSSLYRAGVE